MNLSSLRSRRGKLVHHEEREIQVTPFIDVVLVLLIIFMIATPAILSGIVVDLPSGNNKTDASAQEEFLTVTLSGENQLYLNDDVVNTANIILSIRNKIGENLDKTIFIRGDKIVKYGDIMNIIDILNRAGYKKTILVTTLD